MKNRIKLFSFACLLLAASICGCSSGLDQVVNRASFDKGMKELREDSLLTPEMDQFLYGFLGTTSEFGRYSMVDSGMTYRACLERALEYAAILDTGFVMHCDKAQMVLNLAGGTGCAVQYQLSIANKLPNAIFVFGGNISIQYPDWPEYAISKYIDVNIDVPANGEVQLPAFLVDCNPDDPIRTDSILQHRLTNLPKELSALKFKVNAIRFSNGARAWEFPSMEKWIFVKKQFGTL